MGLRINTNIAGLRAGRILRHSTAALNQSLERLSSGMRINRPGDDAAGLAVAEGFRTTGITTRAAPRNAQDGVSLVQTAEGALGETVNILQRLRELAIQAASGTLSAGNRDDLQLEAAQLIGQINSIANDTEFNGRFPLQAPATLTLQVGARSTTTIVITFATASTAAALGVDAVDLTGPDGTNAQIALGLIDAALTTVNQQRSTLGAIQNRLEFTLASLQIQEQNAHASESAIRDADIALESMNLTRSQILVNAGTSVLSQANLVPQSALRLLGG